MPKPSVPFLLGEVWMEQGKMEKLVRKREIQTVL